jgi:hypothetical protein
MIVEGTVREAAKLKNLLPTTAPPPAPRRPFDSFRKCLVAAPGITDRTFMGLPAFLELEGVVHDPTQERAATRTPRYQRTQVTMMSSVNQR